MPAAALEVAVPGEDDAVGLIGHPPPIR
jgi:hypothetical protein